ncbi:MAG: HD domain-containing protein [Chloroflexi bacterium]|nr:HD domain-containing protein [Chloroflexota bacterium]
MDAAHAAESKLQQLKLSGTADLANDKQDNRIDGPIAEALAALATSVAADGAAVWQVGPDRADVRATAWTGVAAKICGAHPVVKSAECALARTLLQGEVVSVDDLYSQHQFDGASLQLIEHGIRALAVVPITADGAIVGSLMILYKDTHPFNEGTLAVLYSYANILRLINKLETALEQMMAPEMAMLHTLTEVLEARDGYTAGHSNSVSKYAGLIARQMGLSDPEAERVERAAMLHDIGKVGVPDAVLLKPGPLDDAEWSAICNHPSVGARILAPLEAFRKEADLLLHHHERWDGQGYPSGLKGNDIPLGARILAVADVFNALTSARPYRTAHSVEEAIAMLRKMAGVQLDPKVVEAFLSLVGK